MFEFRVLAIHPHVSEKYYPPIKKAALVSLMLILVSPKHELLGQEKNQPSLKETLSWMQSFSASHAFWGDSLSDSLKFDECKVEQTMEQHGKPIHGNGDNDTAMYSLGDLDPTSIKAYSGYKDKPDFAFVEFETTNSRDRISLGKPFHPILSNWTINFDEYASAARFTKAMRRAVVLCGGKPSTF